MSDIAVWCFNEIPGVWPGWTLAIFAVSERDARKALQASYRGGKLVAKYQSRNGEQVKIMADCGLTTEAASAVIRAANQRLYE